ncbi:hypothetical protein AAG906_005758 [Vitis piasezkii]
MAAASSYSSSFQRNYDVFLSFRGEDTRNNFTAHLYDVLCRKGINTFIDNGKLERGQVISPALVAAIQNSMFSIIVLSQNYASSKWCLEELVKIEILEKPWLNMKKTWRIKRGADLEEALTQVANLSGWDSRNKNEALLIKKIVKDILNKLMITCSTDGENLVGMDARIQEMEMLLCLESNDVRMVGIWGMGGIGKTTLVIAIYSRFRYNFEGCSFLENVAENFKMNRDLIRLQKKLLSDLLQEENLNMEGPTSVKERLRSKKVLIILDNVNDLAVLDFFVKNQNWFGQGSRIVITTRDKRLLLSHKVVPYEVPKFSGDEALEFLTRYSLKHEIVGDDFMELSRALMCYAQGLPLALKVLEWRNQLDKLKSTPDMKIYEVLKISYDGLDDKEKNIFLDIACFFKGEDKEYVVEILDGCAFFSLSGIRALIDKSLITISSNKLMMRDLIEEMGREIVCEQSLEDPGKRSRLWFPEDIYDATENIEGIFLNLSHLEEMLDFTTQALARMNRLRLLKVYKSKNISRNLNDTSNMKNCKVNFSKDFKFYYHDLRCLYLYGYSFKSLPNDFNPKNFVELSMPYSRIKQLWKGIKVFGKLKFMDLSHSKYLIETPNFSGVTNLKRLVLEGCVSLRKVHASLGDLKNLSFLSLKNCEKLKSLPMSMCGLKSLETFILSGCSQLEEFPKNFGNLEMLKELHANGTAVRGCKRPPSTSWLLPGRSLSSSSFILHHLPGLCSLTRLNLSYCNVSDETNLSSICLLYSLEVLDLCGNNFVTLPNFRGLSNLEALRLDKCKRLKVLPELPSNIYLLSAQDCISFKNASKHELQLVLPTTKWPKRTSRHGLGKLLELVSTYHAQSNPDFSVWRAFLDFSARYVTKKITIWNNKASVGLDHERLLYITLSSFSAQDDGPPINWRESTRIRVTHQTENFWLRYHSPGERCGHESPPMIPFSAISSPPPPPPKKSTVVLKESNEEEESTGSEWSNVDGTESDNSDYHTATDCSEDHSESENRPQKRLKCRHDEDSP